MAGIEWGETTEYQVPACSLAHFLDAKGLKPPRTEDPGRLLAFVRREALEALQNFLAQDLEREHGGLLVGVPFCDPATQRLFVEIQAAIPAPGTLGSPVHLQFTADAWSYISGIVESQYHDRLIVGWYHSHPGLGVFMSATDRATQRTFFGHAWNVAVVADPERRHTGWFAGAECGTMAAEEVAIYEEPAGSAVAVPAAPQESTRLAAATRTQSPAERLRWLLPFGR